MLAATIFQIHLVLGYVHAVPPDLDVHPIVDNYSTQQHPKARFALASASFVLRRGAWESRKSVRLSGARCGRGARAAARKASGSPKTLPNWGVPGPYQGPAGGDEAGNIAKS